LKADDERNKEAELPPLIRNIESHNKALKIWNSELRDILDTLEI
jgi:hypothetical protein